MLLGVREVGSYQGRPHAAWLWPAPLQVGVPTFSGPTLDPRSEDKLSGEEGEEEQRQAEPPAVRRANAEEGQGDEEPRAQLLWGTWERPLGSPTAAGIPVCPHNPIPWPCSLEVAGLGFKSHKA